MTRLGEIIHSKCRNKEKLANQLGITYVTLYHYMRGNQEPRMSVAFRLAEILKVSVEDFKEPNDNEL